MVWHHIQCICYLSQYSKPCIWGCYYLPPNSLHMLGASKSLPCSQFSFRLIWNDLHWRHIERTYIDGIYKHAFYVCAIWFQGSGNWGYISSFHLIICNLISPWPIVTPYGDMELDQHWPDGTKPIPEPINRWHRVTHIESQTIPLFSLIRVVGSVFIDTHCHCEKCIDLGH